MIRRLRGTGMPASSPLSKTAARKGGSFKLSTLCRQLEKHKQEHSKEFLLVLKLNCERE